MKNMNKINKPKETLIVGLFDCSGSMHEFWNPTVMGWEALVKEHKSWTGDSVQFLVASFDDGIHWSSGDSIRGLMAGGGTNMYPALTKMIAKAEFKAGDSMNVMFMIVTDGSTSGRPGELTRKIPALDKTGRWKFFYIGVDCTNWAGGGLQIGESAKFDCRSIQNQIIAASGRMLAMRKAMHARDWDGAQMEEAA